MKGYEGLEKAVANSRTIWLALANSLTERTGSLVSFAGHVLV